MSGSIDPLGDSARLRAEFNRLLQASRREAFTAVGEYRKNDRNPRRFNLSKMTQAGLNELTEVFNKTYAVAVERRMAQLLRLNQKLARVDSSWVSKQPDEIRKPPPHFGQGLER